MQLWISCFHHPTSCCVVETLVSQSLHLAALEKRSANSSVGKPALVTATGSVSQSPSSLAFCAQVKAVELKRFLDSLRVIVSAFIIRNKKMELHK